MFQLRQFIPKGFCLSCQGCCRYSQRQTPWSALFLYEEILELTGKNVLSCCLFSHADIHKTQAARINLVEVPDGFQCPCLESGSNRCKIYFQRPLDCQLYPFLLVRKDEKAFLSVDENCAYLREGCDDGALKVQIRYLLSVFQSKDFLRLVKNNPEIVQEYPCDLKVLAPLWNSAP